MKFIFKYLYIWCQIGDHIQLICTIMVHIYNTDDYLEKKNAVRKKFLKEKKIYGKLVGFLFIFFFKKEKKSFWFLFVWFTLSRYINVRYYIWRKFPNKMKILPKTHFVNFFFFYRKMENQFTGNVRVLNTYFKTQWFVFYIYNIKIYSLKFFKYFEKRYILLFEKAIV